MGGVVQDFGLVSPLLGPDTARFLTGHCLQYIGLLILIFILELSAGIAGYVCRDAAEDLLQKKLMESMGNYLAPDAKEVTVLWDLIQRKVRRKGRRACEPAPARSQATKYL